MAKDLKDKILILIAGPTAVGKTAVAIKLATELHAEIVSADSRQIFKELTIGTAKPSVDELAIVPHHFINKLSISDQYDAAEYGDEAMKIISELFERDDFVIMCGGSGLYIKAALEGFDDIPEVNPAIRRDLVEKYEEFGIAWLQELMKEKDPKHFSALDQQNPHRLIRALEVIIGTGTSIAEYQKKTIKEHPFKILKIGLELPRELLYQRIDDRMDKMIDEGLFEEASRFYALREHNALQTVGYQEIFDFMEGKYDREEAKRLLKRNSRRYAKRQLTWFKRDPEMKWFSPEDFDNIVRWIKDQS